MASGASIDFGDLFDVFAKKYTEIPSDQLDQRRSDFVFHLEECSSDVMAFADRLRHLTQSSIDSDAQFLFGFFIDGLNHLIAARSIAVGTIPNPFEKSEG